MIEFEPRDWQKKAKDVLWPLLNNRSGSRTHIVSVVTGGGKTIFGIWMASLGLREHLYARVVFVTPPRSNVRTQWEDAMKKLLPSRTHESSVETFMSVGNVAEADGRTLVVIDEFHHLADNQTWGDNVRAFAGKAADRLMLSATPNREDKLNIPFVNEGSVVYEYRYGDAVRDKVCRYICAHDNYDGVMTWTEKNTKEKHTFGEVVDDEFVPLVLPRQQDSRRFNTALQCSFTLVQRMVKDAADELRRMRESYPRAQGMVVVTSQMDAIEVRAFMQEHCDVDPTVISSATKTAGQDLSDFKNNIGNHKSWLVSITLVSEGTDIPNLCVLVYKSWIRTELFMTQVAGRVMRVSEDMPGASAHIYYPKDQRVRSVFRKLQCEADAALKGEVLDAEEAKVAADRGWSDDETWKDDGARVVEEDCVDWVGSEGWCACVDDASDDGSIDAEAEVWQSIAAELEEPDDETEKFKIALTNCLQEQDPGVDPGKVRDLMRLAYNLPPLMALTLRLSEEHVKKRLMEKFNAEVCAYVRRFRIKLDFERKFRRVLAREKSRLVLRFLKRRGWREDKRRKPSDLHVEDIRDLMMHSLPSRITKLLRASE